DDLRRHLLHAVHGPGMLGRHPQRLLLVRCPDLFRAVEADILAANHLGHGKLLFHDDGRAHTTSRVISGMTTWSDTSSYPWLRSCLAMSFALNEIPSTRPARYCRNQSAARLRRRASSEAGSSTRRRPLPLALTPYESSGTPAGIRLWTTHEFSRLGAPVASSH